MSYYIDLKGNPADLFPCTFPSSVEAGKILVVNESGQSMVVEPTGEQIRWIDPGAPNFDSEWTRATALSGFAVFRSSGGVPRAYRMIV